MTAHRASLSPGQGPEEGIVAVTGNNVEGFQVAKVTLHCR